MMVSLIVSFVLILYACRVNENVCIITGDIVGLNDTTILLLKIDEDSRLDGIEIPVRDGFFKYEMRIKHPEAYYLMFKGGGRKHVFFVEPGDVYLKVYPESEFDKNINIGGNLNMKYNAFKAEEDSIYTPLFKPILDSMDVLWSSRNDFFDKNIWEDLNNRLTRVGNQQLTRRLDYIRNNVSLVSYYLLFDLINRTRDEIVDLNLIFLIYQEFTQEYPDHPYTNRIEYLVESINNLFVGGRYIDFTAPAQNGGLSQLSEIIDGKVALIDLWSTWCPNCISKSRSIVPVYEEFKEKGFVVVGVVADKELNRIENRIEKEMHPWLTLVELDKQNRIWEKYGISNWGGRSYLVNKQGTIIAINPSADELRKILLELLF